MAGALAARGGFSWWYADLVDDAGNGVVLIPSWGLPFLPGYASAARKGAAPTAGSRPSIALSVYENGRCAYYLLQEIAPDQASHHGHALRFGNSVFDFGNGALDARLDLEAPGGKLTGTIQVKGVPRRDVEGRPIDHETHEWCPLAGPATGRWSLSTPERRFEGEGSAYIDRNAGLADLESLGVARWTWTRVVLPDRLRIAYALWGEDGSCEATLVDIHEDGRTEALPATVLPSSERRNLWGLSWWPTLRLAAGERQMTIRVSHRPDDGPFYQRSVVHVRTEVGEAHGISEVCDSRRIDLGWQRPLVQMCVHKPHSRNSIWLPLFAGPREGRVMRLFANLSSLLGLPGSRRPVRQIGGT